jgi:hypothetical protein
MPFHVARSLIAGFAADATQAFELALFSGSPGADLATRARAIQTELVRRGRMTHESGALARPRPAQKTQ